jgi:hypothetical protein
MGRNGWSGGKHAQAIEIPLSCLPLTNASSAGRGDSSRAKARSPARANPCASPMLLQSSGPKRKETRTYGRSSTAASESACGLPQGLKHGATLRPSHQGCGAPAIAATGARRHAGRAGEREGPDWRRGASQRVASGLHSSARLVQNVSGAAAFGNLALAAAGCACGIAGSG